MLDYPLIDASLVSSQKANGFLRYDKVQVNSETFQRDVVASKDSVMAVPFRENGDVGIILQQRPPVLPFWVAEFPAGKIDEDSPTEAAIREVSEETGLVVTGTLFVGADWIYPHIGTERSFLYVVKVANEQLPQQLEEGEKISKEIFWMPWKEFVSRIRHQQKSQGQIPFMENVPMLGVSLQSANKLIAMGFEPQEFEL